jgi:hypothetical protein
MRLLSSRPLVAWRASVSLQPSYGWGTCVGEPFAPSRSVAWDFHVLRSGQMGGNTPGHALAREGPAEVSLSEQLKIAVILRLQVLRSLVPRPRRQAGRIVGPGYTQGCLGPGLESEAEPCRTHWCSARYGLSSIPASDLDESGRGSEYPRVGPELGAPDSLTRVPAAAQLSLPVLCSCRRA